MLKQSERGVHKMTLYEQRIENMARLHLKDKELILTREFEGIVERKIEDAKLIFQAVAIRHVDTYKRILEILKEEGRKEEGYDDK